MMKKMVFPAVLMILAGLVMAALFSCDTGDKGPGVTTYTGKTADNKEIQIQVTDGTYDLKIDGTSISTGKVTKNGNTLTLTPNGGGDPVTVTVSGNLITLIEGNITPDDGSDPIEIDILPPFETVAGNWNWFTSDDSKLNGPTVEPAKVTPQTIFTPGGVSRITNALPIPDEDGHTPYIYPAGTVTDNDGNVINATVFNFTGNTKVDPAKTGSTYGAGWPLVGWEAQPADEETLAALKTARGYSFWVRLNSSSTTYKKGSTDTVADNNWAYLTQVVTDFAMEKGYEYKHWFGNKNFSDGSKKMGDSKGSTINNFTGELEADIWHQITVIMDKNGGFNMDQDGWLYKYPPSPDPKGPFNQNAASKIQWQIPLQHNGGAQRNGDPYDQVSGSHDFDLDFYGLELLK